MTRKILGMVSTVALMAVTGCGTNPTGAQVGTATGAVIGGVAGNVIGGGGALGTVGGAAAGAVIGNELGKRQDGR